MKKNNPYISVIIPVYNETIRLQNLYIIDGFLKKIKHESELILVNDGSSDKTTRVINKIKKDINIKLIHYGKNRGKGYAVKMGMLNSRGKYRFFTDIDLSVPLENINTFLKYINKSDVVISSRRKKSSNIIEHQPFLRELLGRGYTLLSQRLLDLPISDFTCGFKCFSAEAAKKIFKNTTIYRWGFDTEVIYLAHFFKFGIHEVPVEWQNDSKTKVKFPNAIFTSIYELLKIKKNIIGKKYR